MSINSFSTNTSFIFLGIKINKVKNSKIKFFLKQNKKSKLLISYTSKYLAKISLKIKLPKRINKELISSFF